MAKRQGRKSAAQTPAPPKERIFGSKKNPKGSASSEKTASKIQLSDQIIKTLEKKLKEFKEKYPSKKNVTLPDLKAVFRRGAGAYSKSHRPFITGGVPNSRNAWAFARVNKFLKKAGGQKVKVAYVQDDDLLKREDGGEVYAKGGLIAPNGKPSNLTPEQYKLVRTPQFKAWFGDWENDPENASKVVDENGEPKVMYHGTLSDFNEFIPKDNSGFLIDRNIYFFTDDLNVAKGFASIKKRGENKDKKVRIINAFINSRKPFDPEANKKEFDILYKITKYKNLADWMPNNWELLEDKKNVKKIKQLGYDSIITTESGTSLVFSKLSYSYKGKSLKNLGAFSPNQIKLADGTNTTFDSDSDDIRYEDGGEVEYEFLKEAEDSEVEDFFDNNDWRLYAKWIEGKGRGTTPHAIYTDGTKYLLERDDYGFDGYMEPVYYFVSIKQSFAKGGEVGETKTWISFFDELEIEDGKKYIGKNFTDVFPFLKHKIATPTLWRNQIKSYNGILHRLEKNKYNNVKSKNTDLNKLSRINNIQKRYYLSRFVLNNQGTIIDFIDYKLQEPKQSFAKGGEIDPKVLRERWAKKKDALENLANNIQRLRTNLSKDLKEGDEKERLTALVVKVMDETGERVGNDVSADNGHFGVTGLKKKHIKVNGSNLKFKYTGKSGVEHEKEINDSTLANAMREAIKNSPSEYVFETSDGFRIKNDRVNRYLNRFDVSAKDLRGYSANKWIITKLKSVKDREILGDAKKRKTKFNEIVKDVAEKVGHGRATLKKHYLLPSLEREFINHGKIVNLSNIKRTYEEGGEIDSDKIAKGGKTDDVKIVESKRNRNVRFTISGKAVAVVEKTPLMDALDYVPYSLGDKDKETRRMYGYAKKEQYLKKQGLKDFNEEFWYLNFIEVKPKYRGQGLASILMKSILKWAKENNIKYLYLYSMPLGEDDGLNEKKLKRFYEKFGFKEIASDTMVKLFARGGANDDLIALPDTYAHYERLKEILRNQGYDLTKKGMARGGDTHDEINTGFDALANLETEPLNELADVPNDGLGIYDKGGKTQYSDGVSKLVNKESIEHLIPTFDEDDINWFKLVHSKDLINQLLENIGIPIKVKYELGEGSYGTAWMTENDTVLKLTKNGAEAYSSYIIFKNQENFRSQAEIYNIFIINDYSKVDVQRIYFIEKQFLNPFQDSKASSISHIYNDIEATATATKYSNNDRLEMLENIIRDENLSDQQSIYARQVFALAKDVDKEARAYGINLGDNHTGNVGFDNSGKLLCYDCAHVGNKKLNKGGNLKNENMENLKVGGEITQEEKKEIYAKWKKLVNMSKSELQKFYDSEEGKQAGLTPEEAKEAGIDSGRESARWVMKMKDTKVADWTPTMWMWAKKQISFVSRMSGNKGKLVDENGKKTRKYLSLLIWGNDPNKKAGGGDIDEPCHVCSMNDAQYQNLPALGEMADGKRFVYRESVFAKGGDTMSHVGDRYLILECIGEGGITDTLNLKVIQSSSPALLVGSVINRPIRNIINKGREMGTTFGQNIVGSYKNGGELNPDNKAVKNYFEHKSGSAGGLLVGKRHSEGGIKAINNSTGQPLEMEGGEVVITRDAVSDPTPVEFEGKKMTKREVLSEINQSGGGVAFADGGVVGEKNA